MALNRIVKKIVNLLKPDTPCEQVSTIAKISILGENSFLANRNILITGGSKGLGAAIAKKCISSGANVLICGRDLPALEETSKHLNCQWKQLDMLDVSSFASFVEDVFSESGFIPDTLVCNAGISLHEQDFVDVTPNSFDKQIGTNLRGPFFIAQAFAKKLIEIQKPGSILFISSETGETPDMRPYGWTKAATNSMVQGLAYRLSKDNIRVNAIAPGITATKMTGYMIDNLTFKDNPNGRVYVPEEMAEVAAFLLSDISGSISGQIITCNNAKTINARWRK